MFGPVLFKIIKPSCEVGIYCKKDVLQRIATATKNQLKNAKKVVTFVVHTVDFNGLVGTPQYHLVTMV